MAETRYTVTGMSCDHCVRAVRDEVAAIAGVTGVEVELDGGRLTVSGDGFTDEQVRAAVGDAGYALA
ncbi:MAG: heavy-metal-associated domain-containing protein [Actinomycetia bacterium]|nr:heavy-metal-associated domain-containing protein [Actinomycetes bacterium]